MFSAAAMRSSRARELCGQMEGGISHRDWEGAWRLGGEPGELRGGCLNEGMPLSSAQPTGHQLMECSKAVCSYLQ